jgi:poly(A) polymerase
MPVINREKADRVVSTLRSSGFKAYFAGGCVRDMIMGSEPVDYDIVTDARSDDVIELFETVIPVGREFGVVVVLLDKQSFEVATFRKEGAYIDGRRPSSVEFTDEEEDAKRRDFTLNGLFYDPVRGKLLDYVGGEEDIRRGIIRSIGDPRARLKEDKLRLLRGIRFAARFQFSIESETEQAITELAPLIKEVSAERIRDELVKILLDPYPHNGVRLMHKLGILEVILPEVAKLEGVEQPPEFHPEGDVFEHTLLMLEKMESPLVFPSGTIEVDGGGVQDQRDRQVGISSDLAMGVLLHDIGKPDTMEMADRIRFNNHTEVGADMADAIMKRLKFSRAERHMVISLVRDHLKFIEVRNMRESTLKRFLMMERFEDHLELHRLDCLASHGDLTSYEFCKEKLTELRAISPPPPKLITGQDLIELGFQPGPLFKEVLTFVEDLQLEGRVQTKGEAEKAIISRYGKVRDR